MDIRFSAVVLILLLAASFGVTHTDSFYVSRNTSLVSPGGGVFELGFFSSGGDRWYFGIWYKKIPKRTYVWVGNRDTPAYNSNATLEISGANLVLRDNNRIIWDTQRKKERSPELVAELLANGNLVLRYSQSMDPRDYLWQSFEHPTNTLLPGMKLISSKVPNYASRRYLKCWKEENNPARGDYIFGLD
ncbi:PREDICTED: S-locus-specific glycoprotein S13-like, partial [Camelina sativa]|uniref:S-locus-specific glycoprotein S13-like n=1 Tax=Camelina sativa TaxID=90675 RepID=A0ABM0Y8H8_CAMSA